MTTNLPLLAFSVQLKFENRLQMKSDVPKLVNTDLLYFVQKIFYYPNTCKCKHLLHCCTPPSQFILLSVDSTVHAKWCTMEPRGVLKQVLNFSTTFIVCAGKSVGGCLSSVSFPLEVEFEFTT